MKRKNVFAIVVSMVLVLNQTTSLFIHAQENILETYKDISEAQKEAQAALEQAKAELASAQQEVVNAQAKVTEAENGVTQAQANLNTLETNLVNKNAEIAKVEAQLGDSDAAYQETLKELEAVKAEYADLVEDVREAQEKVTQAEEEVAYAEAQVNGLLFEQRQLNQKIAAQEQTVADLKEQAENMEAQIQKGLLGFFESMGYEDAVEIINEGIHKHGSTNLGDADDATSLENMKATLEFIKECNALRQQNGLNELLVSGQLMAIAQVQLNHTSSMTSPTHSKLYNVGENIAFGYKDGSPFEGWYYEEKMVSDWLDEHGMTYEEIENDIEMKKQIAKELGFGSYGQVQVGHYENIINPNYLGTGFAINGKGWGIEHGQVFTHKSNSLNTGLMSVDDFFAAFDDYYSNLMNAQGRYEEAKAQLDALKAELEGKITDLEKANADLTSAKGNYTQAQNGVTEAENAVTENEATQKELQDKLNSILNGEENAALKAELEKLQGEKADIESLITTAKGDIETAKGVLMTAKENLYGKQEAVKEAEANVAEKQAILDSIINGKLNIFKDIQQSDWFYDSISYVYNNDLMTGLNETTFGPYENLARAQFAVILHRMNGQPSVVYTNKFPDVATGQWYTDAILWANEIGVVTGYSNTGLFGTGDQINREQMAVMMYRYAQYKGYDTSASADFSKFNDAVYVNEFAKDAMSWAVGTGIITGKDNETRLDPQGSATRAECATIIMRFMEYYK